MGVTGDAAVGRASGPSPSLPGESRLLIVDDDPDILAELSEGLIARGYATLCARTAMEALETMQRLPDLRVIVTDLQLPQIDGIELLQKLAVRRKERPVAAVVITGQASIDKAVAALRLEAIDFLQKPVSVDEVALALRRAFAIVEDDSWSRAAAPTDRIDYLRALVATRTDRSSIFGDGVFADPNWDMLLDLALSEATGRVISTTSLCIAAGVPTTTAMRRIDDLTEGGFIERAPDTRDRRRTIIRLTASGREGVNRFLRRHAARLGLLFEE